MYETIFLYGGPADDTHADLSEMDAARLGDAESPRMVAVEIVFGATIPALGTMRPARLYAVYVQNGVGGSYNFDRVEWGGCPENAVVLHELSGRY